MLLSRQVPLLLAAVALTVLGAGCQDGPLPEVRSLNPWARKQWEEDEKLGPTYYKRSEELALIRARAPALSADEQERLSQEILDVYREETSPAMRAELVATLGRLPAAAAQAGLAAALSDQDPDVRAAACTALGRRRDQESLALLAKTLHADGSRDVRIAAIRALGQFRDGAALEPLGEMLEDKDPAVQRVAMQSLQAATGKEYVSVAAWKEFLAGGNPPPPPGPSLADLLKLPWY
jgi:HEAT repeat protein